MSNLMATRFVENMGNFLGNGQPCEGQAKSIPDAHSPWGTVAKM
ncbi:hypothetical protein KUC_3618 [Vreelandella boliviensis LC1]|uniref:Uncharacterized protein n=1 Tax=Vreelandella boliviensis LC1 TaxID=1072583 RepID=A0A7U9BXT5_9GAMM|nr:hypothetical protein KUC_3618 [Halomonas boliviensis LC1]